MKTLGSNTAASSSTKPLRGFGLLAAMALTSIQAHAGTGTGTGTGTGSGSTGGGGGTFKADAIVSQIEGISGVLSTVSIVVVTIAFVFVGYQVAFGGKHFRDVMPVVIGAMIIGAASQLASMATRA